MKTKPLISVIIPSYNRALLLPRAIQSVLNQTYSNWEMIISDDGSSDNTSEIVSRFMEMDKRIKFTASSENLGVSSARNRGIAQAEGEYIAFLDSDDEWLSHHLEECAAILTENKVGAVLSLWYEERQNKRLKVDEPYEGEDYFQNAVDELKPEIQGNCYFFRQRFYEYSLLEYFYFYHINTAVIRKSVVVQVGGFNESLMACEDTEFLLKVFQNSDICFIKDYHFIYHHGEDNLYAFLDRQKLDLEQLALNRELLDKWTKIELCKIRVRNKEKKKKFWNKKDPFHRQCLDALGANIAEKYFTLGYANRYLHKLRALKFYIRSLESGQRAAKLVYMGKIVFPGLFDKIKVEQPNLNIW